VRRVAAGQYGVITRSQARECGLAGSTVDHQIRVGGPWQRMLPGVYLTVTGEPGLDQRLMAALLYAGEGSLVTGLAALRHYRVAALQTRLVDVLIPAGRKRASREFVVVHRTTCLPRACGVHGPIQFVSPARAAADAARGLARLADVRAVVAGPVQRGLCSAGQIESEVERGPHRHSGLLRAALAEVADGIRSPAEGDLRVLLRRARVPAALFNPELYLGGRLVAVPDAWWPEAGIAVEVDSRAWHLSPGDWERTLRRHAEMTAAGILVLHFSPARIKDEPQEVIATIRAALRTGRPVPGITTRRAA
jgi:hypothetical protein